jgi:hypothetical protein
MIDIRQLFATIQARKFGVENARELIKSSYYFAGTHPDVHIVLSTLRLPDYHFQDLAKYEERAGHTMFRSLDDASAGVAAALNCQAGSAAVRFLSVSSVRKVGLVSRSGARAVTQKMLVRSAIASMGNRTGTMYGAESTLVVVVVLSIYSGHVVLTTAYPAYQLKDRPVPPNGKDVLEYGNPYRPDCQRFIYDAAGT